jgi:membrane-associated phospholipid phosphatase
VKKSSSDTRTGPSARVELIGLVLGFVLFAYLDGATGKGIRSATANAMDVQSFERVVHIDIERSANGWLATHPTLIPMAVFYYRLYYVVLVGVLLWVLVRHADVYVKVRRTLVAMAALVLPVFWALPMSPPRFALAGITDIVAEHDILGSHTSSDAASNHYTAMPSLHVAWSALCAYAAWSALRATHPRLALLWWLFPIVMAADVLITGNHYVLDVVGSGVLLVASIGAAALWERVVERVRDARKRRRNRSAVGFAA